MDPIILSAPEPGSYPSYYEQYFKWVDFERPILETWQYALQDSLEFWNRIPPEQATFRYASDKWSLKEMLSHICDTERIFVFRALSMSRGERQSLPAFNHNAYVDHSGAQDRHWLDLLAEYQHVKQASHDFFASLSMEQWQARGQVDGQEIALSALAFMLPGHDRHHQEIVKKHYLTKLRKS